MSAHSKRTKRATPPRVERGTRGIKLLPFQRRATFRTKATLTVKGWPWEIGREDSCVGSRDLVAIITRCPDCGGEAGENHPANPVCFSCRLQVIVPPTVDARACEVEEEIRRGIDAEQERILREHGWQGGGVHLGIPDC